MEKKSTVDKKSTVNIQKSKWEEQKDKLRSRFPELTDEDLNFDQTKEDEMLGKLYDKLNKTVDELRLIMESL